MLLINFLIVLEVGLQKFLSLVTIGPLHHRLYKSSIDSCKEVCVEIHAKRKDNRCETAHGTPVA